METDDGNEGAWDPETLFSQVHDLEGVIGAGRGEDADDHTLHVWVTREEEIERVQARLDACGIRHVKVTVIQT